MKERNRSNDIYGRKRTRSILFRRNSIMSRNDSIMTAVDSARGSIMSDRSDQSDSSSNINARETVAIGRQTTANYREYDR